MIKPITPQETAWLRGKGPIACIYEYPSGRRGLGYLSHAANAAIASHGILEEEEWASLDDTEAGELITRRVQALIDENS